MPGPPPKRTDQRRNRITPDAQKAATQGEVKIPAASKSWHPIARDWYRSLKQSGQSQFYTASDWQTARYLAELMSASLADDRPNAQLVGKVMEGMTALLTTEGARRKARLELQRDRSDEADPSADAVTRIDDYRDRAG